MGTRNLTIVVQDGQYKVAQYCQWDGYPEGQGDTILKFLKKHLKRDNLKGFANRVRDLQIATEDQIRKCWKEAGSDGDSGWVTCEVSDRMKELYPQFSRDTGAAVLEMIAAEEINCVNHNLNFAADSLFCEWAYVIDLDNKVLEIYRGFNQNPLHKDERFAFLTIKSTEGYYPIKLCRIYSFKDLPTNSKQMTIDCESDEERIDRLDNEDDSE